MPQVLRAVSACVLAIALPVNAAQIGLGDFDGSETITTFDALGLPFSSTTPLVIDGNTYTTDSGTLRYFAFVESCTNECIASESESGFIDIVLGTPSTQVGALVGVGANTPSSGSMEFFSTTDALLGAITYSGQTIMQFAGWEDAVGIGRVRLTDTAADGLIILMEDFRFASAVPIPASVWLFGSGLLGLIGMASKRIDIVNIPRQSRGL